MAKRLGLTLGCWLLVVSSLLASCKKMTHETNSPNSTPADTAKRYLALGDSYTIGQSAAAQERFPYLTVSLLRQQHMAIQDPVYMATTGWTTLDLQAAIQQQEPLGTYDIVTLLIGVNDQYRGWDRDGYRLRFAQLLQKAIELAGNRKAHVFVLSIPDYSATPFVAAADKERVSREIDSFNAINRQVTEGQGVAYIDITSLSRQAAHDPSLLASDGLHYSGKEHQQWAEKLAPFITKI